MLSIRHLTMRQRNFVLISSYFELIQFESDWNFTVFDLFIV